MDRVLEPELMSEELQAQAYAQANYAEPHDAYPRLFADEFRSAPDEATVLDLGCGPCDVTIRFARTFPKYRFHAIDGSAAMLRQARLTLENEPEIAGRIQLIQGLLPDASLPQATYDVIISSNMLHHLADPQVLWQSVRRFGHAGTLVFVTDLFRPASRAVAQEMVEKYARTEPEVLRRDFFNSLLAAFTPDEIGAQLKAANLGLLAKVTSDRHVIVMGKLGSTVTC